MSPSARKKFAPHLSSAKKMDSQNSAHATFETMIHESRTSPPDRTAGHAAGQSPEITQSYAPYGSTPREGRETIAGQTRQRRVD